jgi:hypothetical protein
VADPQPYIDGLFDREVTDVKVIILGQLESSGQYIMGPYRVDPDFGRIESQEDYDYMKRLNYLIQENIADTAISHLKRTLRMQELFRTEEDAMQEARKNYEDESSDDPVDENDNSEEDFVMTSDIHSQPGQEPVEEMDAATAAAVAAVTGNESVSTTPSAEPEEHLSTDQEVDTNVVSFDRPEDEEVLPDEPDYVSDDGRPARKGDKQRNDDGEYTFKPRSKKDRKKDRRRNG